MTAIGSSSVPSGFIVRSHRIYREAPLAKLAAMIPRPRINLMVYRGMLAPDWGSRARVVADGAPHPVRIGNSARTRWSPMGARHALLLQQLLESGEVMRALRLHQRDDQ